MKPTIKNNGPDGQYKAADKMRKQLHSNAGKRMMNDYEASHASLQAGLKPPRVLFDTFMGEADLMVTHKKYEAKYNEEFNRICNNFVEAFEDNDIDRMVELYNDLETMKMRLHQIQN